MARPRHSRMLFAAIIAGSIIVLPARSAQNPLEGFKGQKAEPTPAGLHWFTFTPGVCTGNACKDRNGNPIPKEILWGVRTGMSNQMVGVGSLPADAKIVFAQVWCNDTCENLRYMLQYWPVFTNDHDLQLKVMTTEDGKDFSIRFELRVLYKQ